MNKMFKYKIFKEDILRKKNSIKKKLLEKDQFVNTNIAILGGSTTSEVKNILELFLLESGIKANFYESEYNKFYEDAVFDNEQLNSFNPNIIYLHTTNKNILKYPKISDSHENVNLLIKEEIDRFKTIWSSLSKFNCAIIQNNFDYPIHRPLGNLDSYDIHGKTYFINQINLLFAENARKINNLYINDINYLSSYIGLEKWFDQSIWHQAKYALSINSIPELSFNISKIINSIYGKIKKCLVLDLDNTCWGGEIGEDGLNGIQIGKETPVAEAYYEFQSYIKDLKDRGVSLAVCSKNDIENAKDGFNHPENLLSINDFTSFKANWKPKNENILEIVDEMNIGTDSLVFFDDNSMEREIVSSYIPNVEVPNIGQDVTHFINHLDRNGYFEPISLSLDDLNRNKYYEDNKQRTKSENNFNTYEEFLSSLKMKLEIKDFSNIYLDRITQLINKTNQFNLTSKRYTSAEIENIMNSEKYLKIYGKLSDKFGDNGLIAIIIGSIKQSQCHIDLMLMSCRVLKRGVEFTIFNDFVRRCKEMGIIEIIGYYNKTKKNNMVSKMYQQFGFVLIKKNNEDTIWSLKVDEYKKKDSKIQVTHG